MTKIIDPNNEALNQGEDICGYHVHRIVELEELHSIFYELEHLETGAKHIHISRNDKENT